MGVERRIERKKRKDSVLISLKDLTDIRKYITILEDDVIPFRDKLKAFVNDLEDKETLDELVPMSEDIDAAIETFIEEKDDMLKNIDAAINNKHDEDIHLVAMETMSMVLELFGIYTQVYSGYTSWLNATIANSTPEKLDRLRTVGADDEA